MVDYIGGRAEAILNQCLLAMLKDVQWYFKSQPETHLELYPVPSSAFSRGTW